MKGINEKYCNECAAVISKNAYICPHCGVKQSGINIDSEKLGQTVKVGSLSVLLSLISFIRWASRTAIFVVPIAGAIAAIYFYNKRSAFGNWYWEDDFYIAIAVSLITPIVAAIIYSKTSKYLKKIDL